MKKDLEKQMKNIKYEHHSNLALITTVMAMIGFVVLLFVYVGQHNIANPELVVNGTLYCGVAAWIGAAIFAFNAVKKGKKYLTEYIVYLLVLGFGLFFMYNQPDFVAPLVKGTYFEYKWAKGLFSVLSFGVVIYSVTSIAWHVILATPGRCKKK